MERPPQIGLAGLASALRPSAGGPRTLLGGSASFQASCLCPLRAGLLVPCFPFDLDPLMPPISGTG